MVFSKRSSTSSLHLLLQLLVLTASVAAEDGCSGGKEKLTIVTYNTGLTASVPGFETRRLAVPSAIAETAREIDADVLCFQELWHEKDLQRVIQNLERNFPYHYSAIHSKVGVLRDDHTDQVSRLKKNASRRVAEYRDGTLWARDSEFGGNCSDEADQVMCTLTFCGHVMLGLSDTCRACVTLTATDLQTVVAECADYTTSVNRYNLPGLLVVSKRPLQAEYVSFTPDGGRALIERGFIYAEVNGAPVIVCTHFTVDITGELGFPYIEAGLPYTSYEEQQRAEILTLDTEFSGTEHVLLGDLNTGPASDGVGERNLTGEVPVNYALLESMGYQNLFLETDGRCTHCFSTNTIIQTQLEGKQGIDKAIDHVLTKGIDRVNNSAQRLFDEAGRGALSDHYGVRLDICVPDSRQIRQDL
ncbi:hypothetical protein BaRGS_00030451 [Batillaria attramentaria]|uniref:Endonuclease/exonuclease/phosphatase domain-containing protein n=1 Tax=Batillaria attramentaria TaxID=370345 RepID=A0ABD0JUE8_9CAEN